MHVRLLNNNKTPLLTVVLVTIVTLATIGVGVQAATGRVSATPPTPTWSKTTVTLDTAAPSSLSKSTPTLSKVAPSSTSKSAPTFSKVAVGAVTPSSTSGSGNAKWQKCYGGTGSDWAQSTQQTRDGGYILAGYSDSFYPGTGNNMYVVKTDANGNAKWAKCYGGTGYDTAYSVQQTNDGGYILAGESLSFYPGTGWNMYVVKTDASGNAQWQKCYGGTGTDAAYSVRQTSDGGYIIAGESGSFYPGTGGNMYVVKTDAYGNAKWSKCYGGTGFDAANSVQQTSDGGYIIAGISDSFNPGTGTNMYVVKTDANGNAQWQKCYGGTGDDYANSVQQASDGGYIIAGYSDSFYPGTDYNMYLVKTDAYGNAKWSKCYGGAGLDVASCVRQTSDGGYIIAGQSNSFYLGTGTNMYVVKTDVNGNAQWSKCYGGTGTDSASSVQQTSDGGYIIAGISDSFYPGTGTNMYLVKAD